MKRLLLLAAAAVMSMCVLASCGNAADGPTDGKTVNTQNTEEKSSNEKTEIQNTEKGENVK